jgi:PAS domain S-box-containing protein
MNFALRDWASHVIQYHEVRPVAAGRAVVFPVRKYSMPTSPRPAPAEKRHVPHTIFVVDDDALVRESLRGMLEEDGRTVEDYASCEEFLTAYRPGGEGCLLVDALLPGMSGVELLRQLKASGHQLPSIMITGSGEVQIAVEAMKAGASDFIEKPVSSLELLIGIERVLEQARDSRNITAWREGAAGRMAELTERQREIMDLILAGHPNKNIAADLGLSQRTVETHRATIMKKTGSKSLPALARLAVAADHGRDVVQDNQKPERVEAILATPNLASALENEHFTRFFDQIPLAIIVAEIKQPEHIVYANPEFERLSGQPLAGIEGKPWNVLHGQDAAGKAERTLGVAIMESTDFVGSFRIERPDHAPMIVDAYSNVIEDENGTPTFRLAALVDVGEDDAAQRQEFEQQIRDKDALLLEFQHRVKNNLQMITALIRVEAKNARGKLDTLPFDRLAGRIGSIQLLYKLLSDSGKGDDIDLGVYLSEIVSSVMHSHAVEGIRLNLKVDAYPVSVNVAMPTGLVVNELLTNALKHAFVGRDGGTITLHSIADSVGCRVVIADDGIGLPDGVSWPKDGKLGALIVRSLRQNANAGLKVESSPAKGTCITISFTRAASAPVETH